MNREQKFGHVLRCSCRLSRMLLCIGGGMIVAAITIALTRDAYDPDEENLLIRIFMNVGWVLIACSVFIFICTLLTWYITSNRAKSI